MTDAEKIAALNDRNQQLSNEVERQSWIIKKLQHKIYGASSERVIAPEPEQLIFNEAEEHAAKATPEQTELIPGYERKKKGRSERKPFPEDLPREEVIIDVAPEEKICPHDGTELKEIGFEITEKLKCKPAQMIVLIEKKKKYACPCCSGHMIQGKSHSILPGTIATPELLSYLAFAKYFQGLPLYRIEEQFKLQKIDLSRAVMASWLIKASEKLQPVWNVLEERALASGYVSIDATGVQVLKEPGRAATTKSSMWVRGSPELGIALFDYDVSGGGRVAKRLVLGYSGALQADSHPGYEHLDKEKIFKLGCMMHARRRFNEAYEQAGKKGLAAEAMQLFKRLYRYEEAFKKQSLTAEQRFVARRDESAPHLEEMKRWCSQKRRTVLPASPLGEAISYFLNHYEELTAFLANGRYEIDNGWVERVIRKFAIGRNNWLFADTVAGANASSLLYSLVITAKLNGKDPFAAMTELLRQLPLANSIDDYERLATLLLK